MGDNVLRKAKRAILNLGFYQVNMRKSVIDLLEAFSFYDDFQGIMVYETEGGPIVPRYFFIRVKRLLGITNKIAEKIAFTALANLYIIFKNFYKKKDLFIGDNVFYVDYEQCLMMEERNDVSRFDSYV